MSQFQIQLDGSTTSSMGFTAVAVAAGIKKENQLDLALVVSDTDCSCAAMFTKNQVVAAPVIVDRGTLAANNSRLRAVVINSKNANACTGEPGLANARATQQAAAQALGRIGDHVRGRRADEDRAFDVLLIDGAHHEPFEHRADAADLLDGFVGDVGQRQAMVIHG